MFANTLLRHFYLANKSQAAFAFLESIFRREKIFDSVDQNAMGNMTEDSADFIEQAQSEFAAYDALH